jgi:Transmembrane amino acid transporter protein
MCFYSDIALTSVCITAFANILVGLVGYLSFRDSTQPDILENFSGTTRTAFSIIVIIQLIFCLPGDFVILREALWNLFEVKASNEVYSSLLSVASPISWFALCNRA